MLILGKILSIKNKVIDLHFPLLKEMLKAQITDQNG